MDREKVQHDFDELAHLAGGHSGSDRYDSLLLKLILAGTKNILEIGCGSGRFTGLLADNAGRALSARRPRTRPLAVEVYDRLGEK
jgi:tRNA G46 methylase TrmB